MTASTAGRAGNATGIDQEGHTPVVGAPMVGVCVVNYFSADMVGRLVQSLVRRRGDARLVISCLDNSESPDEFSALERLERGIDPRMCTFLLHRSATNCGYAAGNNVAAGQLDSDVDIVIIANPDVTLREGTLDSLAKFIDENPGVICTARTWVDSDSYSGFSRLNRWTSVSRHLNERGQLGSVRHREVIYPGGHFLATSLPTWQRLGGLSEDFFLFAEEADLTVRALRAGIPVMTTDSVEVRHDVGLTTGATQRIDRKSLVCLREATQSAVIFSRKHNRYGLPSVVVFRLGLAAMVLVRRGPVAAREVLRGLSRGLRARVAIAPSAGG